MTVGVALAELARRLGIATAWRTDRGDLVRVHPDTVIATIAALGHPTTGSRWMAELADVLAGRDATPPPVLVAWDGRLPGRAARAWRRCPVELEDGREVDGLAGPLPPGYHRLSHPGRSASSLVISAPERAWHPRPDRRRFGIAAPLFALPDPSGRTPGRYRDLAGLGAWAAGGGGDVVLTLPLGAQFLDEPFDPSPYSPVSRLMWNELFLAGNPSTSAAPDVPGSTRGGGLIDYPRAIARARSTVLGAVEAVEADPGRAVDLERFLAGRPEVTTYARFRGAAARHGRNWRAWPPALHDQLHEQPHEPRSRGAEVPVDADEVRYHLVAQWLADRELGQVAERFRAEGWLLGLDLAVGTHADGYDTWRHGHLFAQGAAVGAPPDSFFVSGQNWGFPPLLPDEARRTGHDYFRRAIAHHLRHAGLLRIDHVMGLQRLFWIPEGFAPTEGTYVALPAEELYAVVCLESHRAGALVVGEDLGTVPIETTRALARHDILGTWVAQGALESLREGRDPELPGRRTMASLNTHDMPPLARWLRAGDIDDRQRFGMIDAATATAQRAERLELVAAVHGWFGTTGEDDLLDALLAWMAASDALVVIAAVEDLWLEARPQNVPGTSSQHPNWRRPLARTLEEASTDPAIARRLASLGRARGSTPRRG